MTNRKCLIFFTLPHFYSYVQAAKNFFAYTYNARLANLHKLNNHEWAKIINV